MKILSDCRLILRLISNPSKPARLLFFAAVVSLIVGLTLFGRELWLIDRQTDLFLEIEKNNRLTESEINFEKIPLTAHPANHVKFLQNRRHARSLAFFQNSLFAATDSGLLQLSENGQFQRHLTVLDGLPESDLTALAAFHSKLFIGTRSKGILCFDGQNFELIRLKDHVIKSINFLFSNERSLLIGTLAGGLLEFDGSRLREIKAFDKRLDNPIFLEQTSDSLLVGTFSGGLWINRHGLWKNFTTADGLLSNRVVSAKIINSKLFAASDLGVSAALVDDLFNENSKPFAESAGLPTLSAIVSDQETLYLSKDNGEIWKLSAATKTIDDSQLIRLSAASENQLRGARLQQIQSKIYLLAQNGISFNTSENDPSFKMLTIFTDENELTDNTISALALDSQNRLWIGNFRYGIEIFSESMKKIKDLRTDNIREINHLNFHEESDSMIAATSDGIEKIDRNFKIESVNDGLPTRAVFQTAFQKNSAKEVFTASTAKGLFSSESQNFKIYTSLQGLPSNSAHTALFARNSLFVGTLGGLAEIRDGRIVRTFKTSNSALKNNWVSALWSVNQRIFIGTFGGGVYELLPSGEIHSFEAETGLFFVNPNAVFSDGARIYFGTLDGLRVLDLTTQKWIRVANVLPSETVLAITGRDGKLFVGTTAGLAVIDRRFF